MIAPTPRFNVETTPREIVIFPVTFFFHSASLRRGVGEFLQFFHAKREEIIAKKSNFHRFGKSHFRAKMGFEKVFVILCHLVTTSFFLRDFWKSG